MAPNIVFIPQVARDATVREVELGRSAARSHAATISSKYRKGKKSKREVVFDIHGRRSQEKKSKRAGKSIGIDELKVGPLSPSALSPGLLSILREGNSDPFDVLAVPVTARVNEVLSFFKRSYLPMIYRGHLGSEGASKAISTLETQEYEDGVVALHSECSARALLLTYITVMVKLSQDPELATEAMELKGQSLKILREELIKEKNYSDTVIESVTLLFRAALISGRLEEAKVHGQVLRTLLEKKLNHEGPGSIHVKFILRVLYQVGQLSVMTMEGPSVIDVDEWIPTAFSWVWQPVKTFLEPRKPRFVAILDVSLASEPLHTMFVESMLAFWFFTDPEASNADPAMVELIHVWIHLHSMASPSTLVNYLTRIQTTHYVDFDTKTQKVQPDAKTNMHWQTQRILVLGLLTLMDILRHEPVALKTSLFTNRADLLARLRSAVKQGQRVAKLLAATGPDGKSIVENEHQAAHLWTLFIGAREEQRGTNKHVKRERWWCTQQFVLQALSMGLRDWKGVREVMGRFHYADIIMPDAAMWVDKFLGARRETLGGGDYWKY